MNQIIYIYMHKNIINNKVYIGQTNNLKNRWGNNGRGYKPKNEHSSRFWNAIVKYGWDNFEHIILEECENREIANEREKYYIQLYNSYDESCGYNLTTGGTDNYKIKRTLKEKGEVSQIRKEAAKEVWNREGYKEYHHQIMKPILNSEEHRNKLSQIGKERYLDEKEKEKTRISTIKAVGRKIICIELNQIFDSVTLANEFLGKNKNANGIYSCLSGKSKTGYGYHWRYLTEEEIRCLQKE